MLKFFNRHGLANALPHPQIHAIGVPSEKEVLKNGVDLKEMNITSLKKVEELYLYVIELEKKVNEKTSNK